MNNLFVPSNIALSLKEIGFDEPCLLYWEKTYKKEEWKLFACLQYEDQKDINSISNSEWNDRDVIAAPLYDQCVDWFIEKHKLFITPTIGEKYYGYYICDVDNPLREITLGDLYECCSTKYYECRNSALNAGIEKAISLIKEKEKK